MISLNDTIQQRAERLLDNPLRVFYHPVFDDPKQRKNILAEMPELEKFNKDFCKVHKLRSAKISSAMRPCYEAPLLTPDQEQHLFRKMNFFKYKAKKLMSGMNCKRVGEKRVSEIENYLFLATSIRNKIAESNFRLATQLLKEQIGFYQQHGITDGLLSDAYLDVLKAVDYFNWTLGNRFSTYATWVLKKNFFRDSKQKITHYERFSYLDENHAERLKSGDDENSQIRQSFGRKQLIEKLLKMLNEDETNAHRKRQIFVLENYYGINGKDSYTLENIAKKMNISKERVRQLKEQSLAWFKSKMNELKINFDEYEEEI